MSFASLLQSLRGSAERSQEAWLPRQKTQRRRARQLQQFVPRLEALEDRTVLSTLTVLNNADSGPGSLRATIAAASNGDTIVFADSLKNKTITLTSGQLAVSKSLDIEGLGAKHLAISGNHASRVFDMSGSASVTIAGLTITDGLATMGGGILNEAGASVSISKCTLTDNTALGNASGGGFGGAIEDNSSGALTVTNSTFDTNKAIAVGPNTPPIPPGVIFARGGAIDLGGPTFDSTGPATISDSTFTGNQALGGSPGGNAGGGALSNSSLFGGATMTVTGCTLSGNAAIGAAGGDGVINFSLGQGGGINSFANSIVRNSTLTGNLAFGAPLAPGVAPSQNSSTGSESVGGGIFHAVGTLMVADSVLTGNQAVGGAGAAGSAGSVGGGGGITVFGLSSGSVIGCTLADNVARGGAGGSGAVGGAGVAGGIELEFGSSLTVSNTTLTHNQAIGGAGGSGAKGGDGVGGGIEVGTAVIFGFTDNSSLTLSGSTLEKNEALGGAGGSGSNGGNALGGGLAVLGSPGSSNSASISNSTISKNQATGGDGGTGGNGGNGFGGGVFIGPGASLTLTGSTITKNHAKGGKAGAGGSAGQGVGGGVYNLGVFVNIGNVITKNHASTSNDDIFP